MFDFVVVSYYGHIMSAALLLPLLKLLNYASARLVRSYYNRDRDDALPVITWISSQDLMFGGSTANRIFALVPIFFLKGTRKLGGFRFSLLILDWHSAPRIRIW